MIYLDNSATTKPCPEAVAAMTEAMTSAWGNPSALYDFGIQAARQVRAARHTLAKALGAEPDRVFSPPAAPRPTTGPSMALSGSWASGANTSSPPPWSTTPF